jgi:two-component system LytT family sensor kinase
MYIAWWIFWALIQTWVLHQLELSWNYAFIDSVITNGLLALACFAAIILFRYYQPGNSNRIYRLVFALSITILYCISFKWVLTNLLGADDYYQDFLEKSMPIRFIISSISTYIFNYY